MLHVFSTSLQQADKVNTMMSNPSILPVWNYPAILCTYKPGHDFDTMNMHDEPQSWSFTVSYIIPAYISKEFDSIFNHVFQFEQLSVICKMEKPLMLFSRHLMFIPILHCTQVLLPPWWPWVDRQGWQVARASRLNVCMT